MAKSKFKSRPSRRLAFKDREVVLRDLELHFQAYRASEDYFRILTCIGHGGSGKTRLLERISTDVRNSDLDFIRIPLESEASNTHIAPLKVLREQLPFDCLLFDTALLRYWAASGQIHTLASDSPLSESLVAKVAEVSSEILGPIALPVTFAMEVFEIVRSKAITLLHYTRDEFENIDDIRNSSDSLLERLPYYLGSDIERRLINTSDRYVFLYDAYEKQKPETIRNKSPWLREFIGSLERGVHIITGRENIAWPENEWSDVCSTPYVLDELPEHDVRELFEFECNPEAPVLDQLVGLSKCIPFYVNVVINEYLSLSNSYDEVHVDQLPTSTPEAVVRFINHYEPELQTLILSLATIQYFDLQLIYGIVRELNLSVDNTKTEEITNTFFVEILDREANLFKVHDLLSSMVRNSDSYATVRENAVISGASVMTLRAVHEKPTSLMLSIFYGICKGATDSKKKSDFVSDMLDFGYLIYDAGYWRELANFDSPDYATNPTPGNLVLQFFEAISVRRISSVKSGINSVGKLIDHKTSFGKHSNSVELEYAYLTELSGDYSHAKELIGIVHNKCTPLDLTRRDHLRAVLYWADLLIMSGDILKGSNELLSAIENIDHSQRIDTAELMRQRAHAFRFSYLFEEAENQYARAIELVDHVPSLVGKLKTNLAETCCWFDPQSAIYSAKESIEINSRLSNQIELSKAYNALAVSMLNISEITQAEDYCKKAAKFATDVQYPAGILFTKSTEILLCHATGDKHGLKSKLNEMEDLVSEIGIYDHLMAVPFVLTNNTEKYLNLKCRCDWIDAHDIDSRLSSVKNKLLLRSPNG